MKRLGLVFVLISGFVLYFLAVSAYYPDMPTRGQFGDAFGGINALFSGLAFLGIIYAIILQREELGLQRKELELTRTELKRTAGAQERSEKALSRQAESLKVTAKLNGLSARLQHYNTLIELTNSAKYGVNTAEFNTHKREADLIIEEIRRLTDDK
jgi:uncharacterized membrane protein YedE/YeeE